MKKNKKSLKERILFVVKRCFILYILAAIVIGITVNRTTVAKKTLDYLKGQPTYTLGLAEGKEGINFRKLKASIRYYENLLILFPKSAEAYSVLGYCYYQMGKLNKAAHYYQKAVDLDSELFGYHFNLGLIHYERGDYPNAVKSLTKAVNTSPEKTLKYPRHVDPYRSYASDAVSPEAQERFGPLSAGYLKCIELLTLSLKAQKSYDLMFEYAKVGIGITASRQEVFYFHAGVAAYELGQYQQAISYFQMSHYHNPYYAPTSHYAKLAFEKLENPELASKAAEEAENLEKANFTEDSSRLMLPSELYYYPPIRTVTVNNKNKMALM